MSPPPTPTPASDPAKSRFIAIQLIRLTGVGMVMLGIAIMVGKVDLPRVAGYALAAIGLFDAMAMPVILARRWRTPGR
jgi:hypothetical protein